MEKKEDTFTQIVTIDYINLSLNLSALIYDLKINENTKKEKENPNLQLEDRKPNLNSNLLLFWASVGVYIGERSIWKARWGHASKIDAWPHQIAAETCVSTVIPGTQVPSFW